MNTGSSTASVWQATAEPARASAFSEAFPRLRLHVTDASSVAAGTSLTTLGQAWWQPATRQLHLRSLLIRWLHGRLPFWNFKVMVTF